MNTGAQVVWLKPVRSYKGVVVERIEATIVAYDPTGARCK
jgi:hypothetical protein